MDRVDKQAAKRAQQRAVLGEPAAPREGKGQHPLAQVRLGQDSPTYRIEPCLLEDIPAPLSDLIAELASQPGWRFEVEDPDTDALDYELIELQDSSIVLDHWLDAAGQHVKGIAAAVSDDELHVTKPSRDMVPFKSEHEGYQGNYGNTLDRWYHRVAFVMWPAILGARARPGRRACQCHRAGAD